MKLPPLRALQYFEAVARLNSFSAAAKQLYVSQSAVSHQVKLLEQYLTADLFIRQGRNLYLTAVGERYFAEITGALDKISQASQQVQHGKSGSIRLALYSSLAVKWLIPKLADFRQQYPNINLSLHMVTEDPDFYDHDIDCFITINPPQQGAIKQFLFTEKLFPACSPQLWQQIQQHSLPDALWQFPLLSVQYANHQQVGDDWRLWCQHGGFELPKQVKINQFSHVLLAVEAARYNLGITLIDQFMLGAKESGHGLVAIPMHELVTGDDFYFTYRQSDANHNDLINLGRWLKQQSSFD
ncbi:LysR substrate-binding domain-containing protein [Rheinheimera sp. MMS21-TC3]|uniref:LysR substrate-binding domain-containing protein n=1 Tax=Rheinheimera sp. MMS21-TC3 TaxID=3072790 RepID=UPI0028C448EE|nr:LysR substrate-binding domain-containing protein [Rheinheimera sp. MMS21-TC3]WNO61314.1 LysR substrate-binding domain-containing protein [Rheinheimera sp. MMS21-TC3]